MLKFGLEKEVFLIDFDSRIPCVVPATIPHDNEGVQVEYRSLPNNIAIDKLIDVVTSVK